MDQISDNRSKDSRLEASSGPRISSSKHIAGGKLPDIGYIRDEEYDEVKYAMRKLPIRNKLDLSIN